MTTGMRVCLVTPYSPREVSGVGQVVANLGKGLSDREHDPLILTKSITNGGGETPGMVEIAYRDIRLIGGLLLVLGALMVILRRRKSIDVLHLHSISSLTLASALMGKLLGIPTVLTLHGKFPESQEGASFRRKERMTISLSSCVTAVSEETRDFYQLESATVVWNGIDTSRFSPDTDARVRKREELGLRESLAILFIGRWVAHKGIYDLMHLTKELAEKGAKVKLLLVGSGEDEKVRQLVWELGIAENTVLAGRVDDVVPYYRCSDLFVLFTSPLEGLPLTLLEAMACGLPCLATSVSGITEVISDGANGYLIPQGDKKALLERISKIVKGDDGLEKISEKARITVTNRFSLEKMIEGYISIFGSVLRS